MLTYCAILLAGLVIYFILLQDIDRFIGAAYYRYEEDLHLHPSNGNSLAAARRAPLDHLMEKYLSDPTKRE